MRRRTGLTLLAVAAAITVGIFAWRSAWRVTPDKAADEYMLRFMSGDIEWIYAHVTERERRLLGSREPLQTFYDKFILQKLSGAKFDGGASNVYSDYTKGFQTRRVKLSDGSVVTLSALGFVEDGEVVVSGMEWLMYNAAALEHPELTLTNEQAKAAFRAYSGWFLDRGIEQIYDVQFDNTIKLKRY